MMRFQRESSDFLPLTTGKKSSMRTPIYKENNHVQNGRIIPSHCNNNPTDLDGKGFRFRSPSRSHDHHVNVERSPGASPSRVPGDVLLQWGQRKRARVPRVVLTDAIQSRPRSAAVATAGDKSSTSTVLPSQPPPPPPPPPPPLASNGRVGNLRRESSGILPNRISEHQLGGSGRRVSRSATGKRSPPVVDKSDGKMSFKHEKGKGNGGNNRTRSESTSSQTEQEDVTNNTRATEKSNAGTIEWPKIYTALSRKEKEDDFFAMKGVKLPQRPKKRAKHIDRTLQYCFPGMWLSELTRSRYEVREKKCVKKRKRRGLKGMESVMDSDSD